MGAGKRPWRSGGGALGFQVFNRRRRLRLVAVVIALKIYNTNIIKHLAVKR